mmetsp:Transcript_5451/g.20365  ORF Transcript_5451/g.20365 Transcript_5451/m.20365 type:complete len:298 (-) Transcript_5451:129-1022(-)
MCHSLWQCEEQAADDVVKVNTTMSTIFTKVSPFLVTVLSLTTDSLIYLTLSLLLTKSNLLLSYCGLLFQCGCTISGFEHCNAFREPEERYKCPWCVAKGFAAFLVGQGTFLAIVLLGILSSRVILGLDVLLGSFCGRKLGRFRRDVMGVWPFRIGGIVLSGIVARLRVNNRHGTSDETSLLEDTAEHQRHSRRGASSPTRRRSNSGMTASDDDEIGTVFDLNARNSPRERSFAAYTRWECLFFTTCLLFERFITAIVVFLVWGFVLALIFKWASGYPYFVLIAPNPYKNEGGHHHDL